jgi:predicted esterase
MLRLSALFALVLLALAPFGFAQEKQGKEDILTLNAKVIEELKAKKYDDAIADLMKILEITPRDKGTAYNLACAYSLKGELDQAFEWIDQGFEWGWGTGYSTIYGSTERLSEIDMLRKDSDLENVRKDPRFEKLMARMEKLRAAAEALRKKGEEYAATAAVYIPEKVAGLKEMPLLVVLHDAGSTKDEVVKGPWKAIADELGFALVAPSGKVLVGDEPAKGMAWFDNETNYVQKYWTFEKPVNDAVTAFKKEHPIDKARVVIAGEGIGGTVALNVAIGWPALYKGAVALNGILVPPIMAQKAPAAGKMGLRVAVLENSVAMVKMLEPAGGMEKALASMNQNLKTWGIQGEVKSFTPDKKAPDQIKKLLVEAIGSVLPAATPAEAGAPK